MSGLDYYNARYYDPVVGRFLSVDSVQGNMLGFDPYAYTGGNPETFSDPTGHCPWCIIMLAGVVAGAVAGAVGAVVTDVVARKPVTWQDVGKGALIGAGVGLTITGAAWALGAIPAVATALEGLGAGATLSQGLTTATAAAISYSTVSVAPGVTASILAGSAGAGAFGGFVNSLWSAGVNHFLPSDDPQSYEDGAHAQATADAQKLPAVQTAAVHHYQATATATANRQKEKEIEHRNALILSRQIAREYQNYNSDWHTFIHSMSHQASGHAYTPVQEAMINQWRHAYFA